MKNTYCDDYNPQEEVIKLKAFYDKAVKEKQTDEALLRRCSIEKEFQSTVESQSNHNKYILKNDSYCLRKGYPKEIFLDIQQLGPANKVFDDRLAKLRNKLAKPSCLDRLKQSLEQKERETIPALENGQNIVRSQQESTNVSPSIADKKMENIMNNTTLVKSLLDSFMKPSVSIPQNLPPPPIVPIPNDQVDMRNEPQNTLISSENRNNNNSNLINKMENFSNVVQDLLSVMQPFIQEQKNSTSIDTAQNNTPIPEAADVQRQPSRFNQRTLPSTTKITHDNVNLNYGFNARKNNKSSQRRRQGQKVQKPRSTENENTKHTPKALKRIQQMAKDHNL